MDEMTQEEKDMVFENGVDGLDLLDVLACNEMNIIQFACNDDSVELIVAFDGDVHGILAITVDSDRLNDFLEDSLVHDEDSLMHEKNPANAP